jgi:galactonate dehydratase
VATAVSVQAAAVLPSFRVLEFAWGEVAWRACLVEPAEGFVDGAIVVPETPGLGMRLVEEQLVAHAADG